MVPHSSALMSRGKLITVFPGMALKGTRDEEYETVTGQAGLGSKEAVLRMSPWRGQ